TMKIVSRWYCHLYKLPHRLVPGGKRASHWFPPVRRSFFCQLRLNLPAVPELSAVNTRKRPNRPKELLCGRFSDCGIFAVIVWCLFGNSPVCLQYFCGIPL